MSGKLDDIQSFEQVKARLNEIVGAVSDENIPLDEALDLYEEAVALGMKAGDLLEVDLPLDDEAGDVASGGSVVAAAEGTLSEADGTEAAENNTGSAAVSESVLGEKSINSAESD